MEANQNAFWIGSNDSNRATLLLPSRIRLGFLSLHHRAITIVVHGTTQKMHSPQLQVSMVAPSQCYLRRFSLSPAGRGTLHQGMSYPESLPAGPVDSAHHPDPTALFRSATSSSIPDLMVSAVGLGEIAIPKIFVSGGLTLDTPRRARRRNRPYFDSYFTTNFDSPSNAGLGFEGDCNREAWSRLSVHANAPQGGARVRQYQPN